MNFWSLITWKQYSMYVLKRWTGLNYVKSIQIFNISPAELVYHRPSRNSQTVCEIQYHVCEFIYRESVKSQARDSFSIVALTGTEWHWVKCIKNFPTILSWNSSFKIRILCSKFFAIWPQKHKITQKLSFQFQIWFKMEANKSIAFSSYFCHTSWIISTVRIVSSINSPFLGQFL